MDQALFNYSLRLGDSALVLAQRLCEWTGHGPALEEELATANTGLDLIGQARMWLSLAGEVEGKGRDEDDLAYLRDTHDYYNYLIAERPNGHYGDTMARQFLFDVWHYFLLRRLCQSSNSRVQEIAEKSLKEVTYHVRRSIDLVIRLGDGTEESHQRMQEAINDAWKHVGELFLDDDVTRTLHEQGVAPLHESLWDEWYEQVGVVLSEATLIIPAQEEAFHKAHRGGTQGHHTEALGFLLAEMQVLQRTYPGASW